MSKVELRDIHKRHGATLVLRGLSLEVAQGSLLALLGPSGCGKTTTLRAIAGLDAPDSGTIVIGDRVVDQGQMHVAPERRGLGMVFQSYAVWPHRTVAQNVAYPLMLQKRDRSEISARVAEALGWVRLGGLGDRLPQQLSGGQLQRVALARALVASPRVLLLDEPLSNLDLALREELRGEIAALRARLGTTMILVTHDQSEALALADSVAVMSAGRLEQLGAPATVYREPATAFVARFVGGANVLEGFAEGGAFTWGGLRFALPSEFRAVTGPGSLAVRPEDVLVRLASGDAPALPLSARLFAGESVEYRFEVNDMVLRSLSAPIEGAQPGVKLGLEFRRARFFAHQ